MKKGKLLFVIISVFLCAFQSIYANNPKKDLTNWTDGGSDYVDGKYAYDTSWYDASASEYTISTPEELAAFAAQSATETFADKTVKLTTDLDMSKYGWVSIGKAGFKGTFDGMGHTITGMTYKDADQAKAWGFFHTIDEGTVKNVIITGSTFANEKSGTDCPSVGGIASILKNGVISNCGFSGTVHLPFDEGAENLGAKNGLVGGLVGIIEAGTVSNSYVINNGPVLPNDTIYGNITGRSNGTITNCYYLENETFPDAVNKKQEQGTLDQVFAKPAESFASGEVAYLLNAADNAGTWGVHKGIPVLAGEHQSVVYKINYPVVPEHGKVTGVEYACAGEEVTLTSTADEGYFIKDLTVSGVTLTNNSTFVMPEEDVTVSYTVAAISGSEIMAFPAENIRSKSFVAKWNKVDGATDYKITVKYEGTVLEPYNALSVGDVTSISVEGLAQNSTYTYTIQSVSGGVVSSESNTITVVTASVEAWVTDIEARAVKIVWDNVTGAEAYLLTITDGFGTFNQVETTACEYRFVGLSLASTYTITVVANDGAGEPVLTFQPIVVTTSSDYGTQLTNITFEAWEKEGDNAEPVGWNSFMSGDGSLSGFTKNVHMEKSEVVRPGSTGNASVRIWTKAVVGVPANGNLTTGRINSGSMSATDQANHNRTVIDNPEFNQPLNGAKPDSLTVWVNYSYSGNTAWTARVAATIHDTYNFADPSATVDSLHAVAKAEMNYPAVDPTNGGWQRLSIPFDYELKSFDAFYEKMNNSQSWKESLGVDKFVKPTSADYMLVTFTTNSTPGKGAEGDQVLIDDMLLIYKPVLKLTKSVYQSGEITVDYTLTGTMSPSNSNAEPNVVSLELSDATGSFANPTVLTEVVTDKGGQLTATIEGDLAIGNYKVRVVTTNYPMVSEEFSAATGVPVVNVIGATEVEESGFVANWEVPSVEPVKYLLTVKQGDEVVGEYNDKEVGDVTSYKIEGLVENTTYTYTVKAVYDEVVSGASSPVEVITSPVIKGLAATDVEEDSFVANWETPVSVQPTNYLFTVKEGDVIVDGFDNKEVGLVTDYKVEGLKKNTTYTYTVTAVYGGNVAKASDVIEVRTLVAAVKALTATDIKENTLVANWEAPASMEPTGYLLTVKKGDDIVEGYNDLEVGLVTSYEVEGLDVNTTYAYTVKAVYGELVSKASNTIEVTTLVPAVEALAATEVTTNAFVANWEAPTSMEPTAYLLTVRVGDVVLEDYTDLEVGLVTSYEVEGLDVNTTYTYTVKAVYGELTSKASNVIEVTTLVPTAKALAATEITTSTFVANWEAPTSMEPTNYLLTVKEEDAVVEGYDDLQVGTVTSYKVEGLKANTVYTYTVKAVYDSQLSSASEPIEVTTLHGVGIGDVTMNGMISVYPNPAIEYLYINGVTENSTYAIYDMSGKNIGNGNLLINKVDVSKLKTGMYFIETESGKAKFIKK